MTTGFILFTGWTIKFLGFDSLRGLGIFLFTTASRMALGHTQPPIQWVPGVLSLGVKLQGREAHHSPPISAEVKERVELYLHSPNTPPWCGPDLKHSDNSLSLSTFVFTRGKGEGNVMRGKESVGELGNGTVLVAGIYRVDV
jgi:hypothetical protein